MKYYFKTGLIIIFVGSAVINILLLIFGRHVCRLFGADAKTLEFSVLFGSDIIWYTFVLYEAVILILAFVLLRCSERNSIIYK